MAMIPQSVPMPLMKRVGCSFFKKIVEGTSHACVSVSAQTWQESKWDRKERLRHRLRRTRTWPSGTGHRAGRDLLQVRTIDRCRRSTFPPTCVSRQQSLGLHTSLSYLSRKLNMYKRNIKGKMCQSTFRSAVLSATTSPFVEPSSDSTTLLSLDTSVCDLLNSIFDFDEALGCVENLVLSVACQKMW